MRRWIVFGALAVALAFAGCKSTPHPPREKEEAPAFGTAAPDGNGSPFQ